MSNRQRLTVRLGADWKPHTSALAGWEMLGTVERGAGDVGALARSPQGEYWQVNAQVARSLNQRKVLAALQKQQDAVEA
jgi:hypothetical protein